MSYQTAIKFIEKMGYEGILSQDGFETLELTVTANHTPKDAKEILEYIDSDTKTITVNGFFGEKQVTQEEFVKEWEEHTKQLWRISYEPAWMEKVSKFNEEVVNVCIIEFNRIYKEQS